MYEMLSREKQYNLLWLLHAMTLPTGFSEERYYYDGSRQELFYTINNSQTGQPVAILNNVDMEYNELVSADLAVRLELVGDEASEITEVPRFNVNDKIHIQLDFMSGMPEIHDVDELIFAVEGQKDDHRFVLDKVFNNNKQAEIGPLWDDYKLRFVFACLDRFAKTCGIPLFLC